MFHGRDYYRSEMEDPPAKPPEVEGLLAAPELAEALRSEQFRSFLDQVPVALIVSALPPAGEEAITYANPAAEKLLGLGQAALEGQGWAALPGEALGEGPPLGTAAAAGQDYLGSFRVVREGAEPATLEAYASLIEDEAGRPTFRLLALVDISHVIAGERSALVQRLQDSDLLLREMQHRVKNNLQLVTALIRIEARNAARGAPLEEAFDRLAGRVEAIALLYRALDGQKAEAEVDLGSYLSQVASAVMGAHAASGIRLELKVDAWPVSVNVAMPAGLVVNELLTNALKHAFTGKDGGTVTLQSLVDAAGCEVLVADDGNGLPEGMTWPQPGRLGALIVRSLEQNALARVQVESKPGKGLKVRIRFSRAAAAPKADKA
ncbi:sensor histidine kinase [Siccirubricoccus phaeus]|uniref:sensor histidine kinase n=1 Tax=Siccirubricoccus phaeus TaxID=2595053 RepID=UPI001F42564A|nr:histidine kinase dimerization/phosphoacceptor domain -containing protein [Siccirubricoccus phaeus]